MRTVTASLKVLADSHPARLITRFAFLFLGALALSAAEPGKKKAPGSDIFEGTNIVRISITIPPEGLRTLQGYYWGNSAQDKPEAKATITEGGVTYKHVAVHLNGAAGSFRDIRNKPGLTLNFDKFTRGQTFHGLEKISL